MFTFFCFFGKFIKTEIKFEVKVNDLGSADYDNVSGRLILYVKLIILSGWEFILLRACNTLWLGDHAGDRPGDRAGDLVLGLGCWTDGCRIPASYILSWVFSKNKYISEFWTYQWRISGYTSRLTIMIVPQITLNSIHFSYNITQ